MAAPSAEKYRRACGPWSVTVTAEDHTSKMLTACISTVVILVPLILLMGPISTNPTAAEEESGTTVPAETHATWLQGHWRCSIQRVLHLWKRAHALPVKIAGRPCVDCHAFEFMQRALQDLKKTAYSLDSRTETLLFKVEKRTLCDCLTANTLN
ncbi:hypothetical protein EYD10_14631 [Varanus komodoensis]|nr:hypothetical protein EYD10_14631 [Varanus komodoensis]